MRDLRLSRNSSMFFPRQVEQWDANTPLSTAGSYDATRTGPLCYQVIILTILIILIFILVIIISA